MALRQRRPLLPPRVKSSVAALERLIRPASVAVIGASASRTNNGNVVVVNLRAAGYSGTVIPIHPHAAAIEDYPTVRSTADLPGDVDVAIVSVPAADVGRVLRDLDNAGVASAIVMSAGFTPAQEAEILAFCRDSRMIVQGPNCMGLLNVSEGISLYTAIPSSRVRPGRAALIAQSGSAAISVMNSTDMGFSKVITSGSQYRLSAADFITWLADDPHTAVIGLVLESIPDADHFADAVEHAATAGKPVVMLKVGQSPLGAKATQAHTGALIRDRDATDAFFRRYGLPTVRDYDELLATLDCFATIRAPRRQRNQLAIVGISGGEAALTCDLADQMGIPIASFTAETTASLRELLPGANGLNPVDFGASVGAAQTRQEVKALDVIAADPNVDTVFVLQDAQHSLAWRSSGRYTKQCENVAQFRQTIDKPVVVVSSSGEALHAEIRRALDGTDIPLLRGLRPALAAMAGLGTWFGRRPDRRRLADRSLTGERAALRAEISAVSGPLSGSLTARLLEAYGLPVVQSVVVDSAEEALSAGIGFPLVVKVVSQDVPHRSDIGAVRVGISDPAALQAAILAIEQAVRTSVPHAVIEGYELQEQLSDAIEAVAGFKAAPPFGALTVVGTGGTLVELQADRAISLSPVSSMEAASMIAGTRLGRRMDGYRNLLPPTNPAPLAALVAGLSELAADLYDVLAECDLNPVLVQPGSGTARIVDALFVAGRADEPQRSSPAAG